MSATGACQRAKVSKSTYFLWRQQDAGFERECVEAIDAGVDLLEDEAYRRATTGGSDTMLIFLMKGKRPALYNRKTLVVEGNPDKPLQGNATVMIYPKRGDTE